MRTYIKELTVLGVKNIDKLIKITFLKDNIQNIENIKNSNVKAIYGPNGSGKTAVVHSIDIIRSIILEPNYLRNERTVDYLDKLFNKKCKKMELGIKFYTFKDDGAVFDFFTYKLTLGKKDKDFVILDEKYAVVNSKSKKETIILESKNGITKDFRFDKEFESIFINLLDKQSFISRYLQMIDENKDFVKHFELFVPILSFVLNTEIVFDNQDKHITAIDKLDNDFNSYKKIVDSIGQNSDIEDIIKYNRKIMSNTELEKMKAQNSKRERFIKMFKPDILSIDIVHQQVKESKKRKEFVVTEFINYGDYKIDLEFESVGIKKLFSLYNSFKNLRDGKILIIDEIDAHINDVYLTQLVEYISNFTNGQLIFTTHNLSPMEVLKDKKHSIDFMSNDSSITPWKKIGNYSPSALYKKGMVEGLPFNIEAEDFIEVFEE